MMVTLFFISAVLCGFSYFIYPLILQFIPVRKISNLNGEHPKKITLIITAHNEEACIRGKLENTLEISYPAELLEIIVASDCSTDGTDEIVATYSQSGVHLVRADERKGKEYAQLCAIREAKGDILVFSDVATQIEPEALNMLVRYFDGPLVGAVSSEDRFVSQDGSTAGEGVYVKYEMWLRRLESPRAGLVGLSGSFFAARREICDEWDIASPSDFNTALNCAKQGVVAISAPDVVGIYSDVKVPSLEYQRKLRTTIHGITAISRHPEVLNPYKMGMFAFQVWSHKILRWAVPWFMGLLLLVSIFLSTQHWFFGAALAAQVGFYALVIAGCLSSELRSHTIIKIPYFFVQVNLAIASATVMFLRGERMTTWTPSKR